MLNWIPPEQAPKDGTQILAAFESYPFPVMAVWCGASGTWCAAVPQVDMYQGELNDWYFENEHFPAEHLKVWGDVRHNALAQGPGEEPPGPAGAMGSAADYGGQDEQ